MSEINLYEIFRITSFTICQAFLSTFIAVAVGLPMAFFTARRNFVLRQFILSLSTVPLCVPALIVALGYVTFFGMSGTLNHFFMFISGTKNPPVTFLYSFLGIVIAQGFYNFPLVMSTVSTAWETLPQDQQNAAKLLGAGNFKIFRTITIFQLLPSIISACIPVFLFCFFSFMIVLLFGSVGCTTLEVEIYHLARSSLNFNKAFFYILIETFVALAIVLFYATLEQKSAKTVRGISFDENKKSRKPLKSATIFEKFVAFILFFTVAIFFLAPLFSILQNALTSTKNVGNSFTLKNFTFLLYKRSFWNSILWTLITATATGTFSAIIAFAYSSFLHLKDGSGKNIFFRTLPILPMAISSVALGVLITMIVRRGNVLHLILAQTFINWPLAFRQIFPKMQKIGQDVVDSSRLLSKNIWQTIFKIFLPVCAPEILRGALFCFALSAGDTTLPLVMAIPRFDTLALFTYRLAGAYKFNQASAAGLILAAICIISYEIGTHLKTKSVKNLEE